MHRALTRVVNALNRTDPILSPVDYVDIVKNDMLRPLLARIENYCREVLSEADLENSIEDLKLCVAETLAMLLEQAGLSQEAVNKLSGIVRKHLRK